MKIFEKEMKDGVTCKYRTILSVEIYGFRGALRALMLLREDDERVDGETTSRVWGRSQRK